MDIYAERFTKYDGFLELPLPKIKDLVAHAAFLVPEKREQYLCLQEGFEEELAALKLRPLVLRRVKKEWAARQEAAGRAKAEAEERAAAEQRAKEQEQAARHDAELAAVKAEHEAQLAAVKTNVRRCPPNMGCCTLGARRCIMWEALNALRGSRRGSCRRSASPSCPSTRCS
jgi:hypothetical protein